MHKKVSSELGHTDQELLHRHYRELVRPEQAEKYYRLVMLLTGTSNNRDVITFPENSQGRDLMMGAPSEVSEKQLRELHIQRRKG